MDEAIELLEKANADLEPELVTAPVARKLLEAYARAEKLAAFGVAALARKLDDTSEVARLTGTSAGKAKAVVSTGNVMGASDELTAALQYGKISLDQAGEIAPAVEAAPGAAAELLSVAQEKPFHVLKEKARKVKLEAEQHKGLSAASTRRDVPAATLTNSGWCTSISPWSRTSAHRSWLEPRPKPLAPARRPGPRERRSLSSAISRTHSRRSYPVLGRGGQSDPSWWCS